MRLPIRARLTLWYSALMILALTAFSLAVLSLHAEWGRAQFDSELVSLGAETARVMQEELSESGNLQRAVADAYSSMDVPDRAMAILDVHGTALVARWRAFRYDTAAVTIPGDPRVRIHTITDAGREWRVLMRRESSPAGDYVILVAGTLDQLGRQQWLLSRVLLVAAPLAVLLAATVCWWVASSALRPVTSMAAQAEAITVQSVEWRLDVPPAADELGQLARAFNRLLNRLGTASQRQRQFMADASHELRTPVSVIQTATEVTLGRDDREQWEYREALTIIQEQSTRLSRTVEDMLVLARADAGGYRATRRLLYVDELVAECTRAASVLAALQHISLVTDLETDVSIHADDGLIRQLVTNLIDNAVRYTPPDGIVTVVVRRRGAVATITVSDTGPGIPAADRERVFERFVRLDPARSVTPGAGLGLAIARWIAEQHEGTLTLDQNATGGCAFTVRLPLKPSGTGSVDARTAVREVSSRT
jgi:two-component system OmpR family sensor kinase